jgi:hypothetical protein
LVSNQLQISAVTVVACSPKRNHADEPARGRQQSLTLGTVPDHEAFLVVCAQDLHAISQIDGGSSGPERMR